MRTSPDECIVLFVLRHPPLSSSLAAVAALAALAAVSLFASAARGGGGAEPDARVIRSVFFIAKSENKNQVHYGIHLDKSCAPEGDAPVFAYWRMLERGPLATEPLLSREVPAYGVYEQRLLEHSEHGGRVFLALNAMRTRPIIVESAAAGPTCATTATTAIGGVPATLESIFVQLRWPFGVESIVLSGRASFDGRLVYERMANP